MYRYREALAKRLLANKDYDEALTEYTEAAKLAPNEFFAEQMDNQQIEIYRRQGALVEKISALETELERLDSTSADAFVQHKQLAKMYLKLGNTTYALEILLKAKNLQPDDVIVNRWIAEVYTLQGRRDNANAVYTHLIEVDSANAREYYTNIARSHLEVMDLMPQQMQQSKQSHTVPVTRKGIRCLPRSLHRLRIIRPLLTASNKRFGFDQKPPTSGPNSLRFTNFPVILDRHLNSTGGVGS